jgi:hypothetical protein
MGARLRRNGKAGVVSMLVALALVASAWLAYASGAPNGTSSYPPPTTPKTTTPTTVPPTTVPPTTPKTTTPKTTPATTTPKTTVPKKKGNRIKAKGYCSTQSNSRFQFDVRLDSKGNQKGQFHTQVGDVNAAQFQGHTITNFQISGNTGTFTVEGKIVGAHPKDTTTYFADVTVTDDPDTIEISIHNGSVIYTLEKCDVVAGSVVFVPTN